MNTSPITIDAKGRTLGRVASEAAALLMGKNSPDFAKNKVSTQMVIIANASHTLISPKKKLTKEYTSYSGYPGGLKIRNLEDVITKKGMKEVYETAVYGMLPHNKLRSRMIKHLTIKD